MSVSILNEDCLAALPRLAAEGFRAHSVVCDPPYHLTNNSGSRSPYPGQYTPIGSPKAPKGGFMGQQWDGGDVAFRPETWAAVRACMRPGALLAAFGGTRTSHRMTCAIEDAGFEIRDTLMWLYGSGFPKSLDVSKAIDRAAGADREVVGPGKRHSSRAFGSGVGDPDFGTFAGGIPDITAPATPDAAAWSGWGTALKPAWEPIILARVPLDGTVAGNTLKHGCGGLNIDACRVGTTKDVPASRSQKKHAHTYNGGWNPDPEGSGGFDPNLGRWPANVLHDGSPEVEEAFARFGTTTSTGGGMKDLRKGKLFQGETHPNVTDSCGFGDTGSVSRYFFCAKADSSDRAGSKHPTVKPAALMRWLVQLTTPPGGTVLDPFAGTGSTGLAADQLGMDAVLIERDPVYAADARRKITADAGLFAAVAD